MSMWLASEPAACREEVQAHGLERCERGGLEQPLRLVGRRLGPGEGGSEVVEAGGEALGCVHAR